MKEQLRATLGVVTSQRYEVSKLFQHPRAATNLDNVRRLMGICEHLVAAEERLVELLEDEEKEAAS